MFDLGWGGVDHFNGSALMGVAWMSGVGVGIMKSVSKRRAIARIFGWTLVECAVVSAVVFTLVRAFVPLGNAGAVAGDFAGTGVVFGLIGNTLWQLRLEKKDAVIRELRQLVQP